MRRAALALSIAATLAIPTSTHAHGIWGHVHVTGWAVENMPDDELRAFLLEPEVFNALLFGAVFTDTGYARDDDASRAYSEHTHWEPFIEDYIEWIRVNDPPPWDDIESKKRIAFLMGCASHGLQDSMFDSIFLPHIEEQDGASQDEADPGTDGFLVLDEHIRFVPEQDIPMDTLLSLYETLGDQVTEAVILDSVELTLAAYVNDGVGLDIAAALGTQYEEQLSWTRTHYLDASVPSSLRAEIYPTMKYQQAIWSRLHDEFTADEATVFAFPEAPRRLMTHEAASAGSWMALIFGAGVQYEDGLTELVDASGAAVPFTQVNTRWNAEYTRVLQFRPVDDLVPGDWYTARLKSGVQLIDGQQSTQPWELSFQVECDGSTGACDDLGDIPEASIDGIPEVEDSGVPPADDKGCGCSGVGAAAPAWVAVLALLGARRREPGPI